MKMGVGEQALDEFLRGATGRTLYQLKIEAKLASSLDSPEGVSKFIDSTRKRGYGSMVLEYWINGLISGPATHVTYTIGNTILSALRVVAPLGDLAPRQLELRVYETTGRASDTRIRAV